ncbi:hydroxyproline dehydrogenase isoform X2 [Kryptolebias marmoratus]|uniref:hydroxyproline dehydrogenase isoform X2 n=1 Tax=Kryptolebias marmoratus TaxID=37003 RepID=UPI0007F93584|nr:hydroxyproline dehydrogenase isoform X2 [Kryptolebias marmoratus]
MFVPPGRMLYSISRPSLPHLLSLRLLGTAASRTTAVKQNKLLSGTLNFDDPSAFRVKSWGELLRALGIFRLCSFPVLVNYCGKLMSVARTLLGKRGFSLLLRPTVYAQFVAGENETEISQSMKKMSLLGLRPMLAVPMEEDLGESTGEKRYDDNMEAMLDCVRMSHSNAWSRDPMMQLKVTALLSPELCVKLTTLAAQQPYDLSLLVKAMDGETISFPGLEEKENAHFLCGLKRLNKIAEESRSLLLEALRLSDLEGFCLGVKLVRGAYMDKERKLAAKEGRVDPIHKSWEDTNHSYNGSLDVMLEVISQKPECHRIIVATHNEESVRRAAERMEELGIEKNGGSVCFGQLLGMCDHVSLTLAKESYIVYKSVPYGSVDDTLPYLVRRAQENRTVLQGIRKERDLLRKELQHRLKLKLRGGS